VHSETGQYHLLPFLQSSIPRLWDGTGEMEPVGDIDELALVRELRSRHNTAVATFLERYRPLLLHCIGNFEQDHSTRDDLFQDVVLYIFDRLDANAYDPSKGSLGTWLYRVAWCRVVDLKRRDGGRRTPRLTMVGDQLPERVDASPTPGEAASTDEIGQLVRRGLAHLDGEERSLLVLRFVDGRTMEDIAAALGISLEQAKYRVKRASAALRRVLVHDYSFEDAAL